MKRTIALLLLALVVIAPAAPAWAAASSVATATSVEAPRVTPSLVDVQLWTEDLGTRTTLIVVGTIPTSTPLPAAIVLPVPRGAQLTWAGEIFDDSQGDVSHTPTFAADRASVSIVATKSRKVQYEAQYDPYVDKDGRRHAKLAWVQSTPADKEQFAVQLPLTSDDINVKPGSVQAPLVNRAGDKLFVLAAQTLKVGGKFDVSVDYLPRLPLPAQQRTAFDYVLPVTIGLVVLCMAALVVLFVRSRTDTAPDDDPGSE